MPLVSHIHMRGERARASHVGRPPMRARRAFPLASVALLFLLAIFGAPGTIYAQARVIDDVIVNNSSIIEQFAPPDARGSVRLSLSDARRQIPPERAAALTFVLREVSVEGATILPPADFAHLWRGRIGQTVSLPDLYGFAEGIEKIYLKAGVYAAAVVPLQDFESGQIAIRVFDRSFIRAVEIKSDIPHIHRRLAPYIDKIAAMRPIRVKELERALLLMTDLAGLDIEATLSRPEIPGTGGYLMIVIDFARSRTQIGIDNHGSRETGPVQLSGQSQINDLLGLFETTTLTGLTVPASPEELVFGQLGQEFPVGSSGLHIGYRFGALSSRPGGDLAGRGIDASSTITNLFASYPLMRTIETSVFARLSFNASDSSVDVFGRSASRDRQRWLELELSAEGSVAGGAVHTQAAFLHGLDVLSASNAHSTLASRPGAPAGFRVVKGSVDVAWELSDTTNLALKSAGQLAFDPLPAAVQFTLGGHPFGRAFEPGVASGDSGFAVSVEVARELDLELDPIHGASVFGFVDYGAMWSRGQSPADGHLSLGSAGLGLRAGFVANSMAELGVAVAYDDSEPGANDDARFFFQIGRSF